MLLMTVIFFTEALIMVGLSALPIHLPLWIEVIVDSSILVLLVFPTLYFFIFRQIMMNNFALRATTQQLRLAQEGIEKQAAKNACTLNEALAGHKAHVDRLACLNESSQLLLGCNNMVEIAEVVGAQMARLLPSIPGAFFTYRSSRDAIERVASWNSSAEDFPETMTGGKCWALRRGRLHIGGNAPNRLQCGSDACDCKHALCLPLVAAGEVLGLIVLRLETDPETTPVAGLARNGWQLLLSAFRESVAVAVSNVRLRESLHEQAFRDQLTGLFNRRFIDETLRIDLAKAARSGETFSVAMVDVDHFRTFNDTHGHEAGDLVLSTLGAHFIRCLRQSDTACRYGGEEFLIVLPGTTRDMAMEMLEMLRSSVEALLVRVDAKHQVSVTVSCGVATYPLHGEDEEELIRKADGALYYAKRNGRNRVANPENVLGKSVIRKSVGKKDAAIGAAGAPPALT